MSDQSSRGGDATTAPSEAEIREYVEQLRAAPVEQIVSEIVFGVLNAAQAKLGRRDGRLLIDTAALVMDHVRPHVPAEVTAQVDQIVRQLQLSQVQAEGEVAARGEVEPGDLTADPPRPSTGAGRADQASGPAPSGGAPPAGRPAPQPAPSSRLLIPGRDF